MTKRELILALQVLESPDDASVVFADYEDLKVVLSDSLCGEPLIILSDRDGTED